jgi:hypothetical protein
MGRDEEVLTEHKAGFESGGEETKSVGKCRATEAG